jgi:hypothetical protein
MPEGRGARKGAWGRLLTTIAPSMEIMLWLL